MAFMGELAILAASALVRKSLYLEHFHVYRSMKA